MPPNVFDKASRYAAKIDPQAFFAWVTGLPAEQLAFSRWLDTRAVPLPQEPDQIGDTVARIDDPTVPSVPWRSRWSFRSNRTRSCSVG